MTDSVDGKAVKRVRTGSAVPRPSRDGRPATSDALLSPLLRSAVAAARRIANADRAAAALAVVDAGGDTLVAAQEGPEPALTAATLRAAARLVRLGGAVSAPDITQERSKPWRAAADAGVRSLAVVPLRIGLSEGCLLAASDSRRGFSMTDLAALEAVAACAAAASDRMLTPQVEAERAVHELHDSFGQTLRALVANLDRLDEILAASAPQALGEIVRVHALRALRELRGVVDTALRGAPTQGDRAVGMAQLSDELRRSGIA